MQTNSSEKLSINKGRWELYITYIFVKNGIFLLVTDALYMKIYDGGESNETFQLTTLTPADKLYAVLCENGK